MLITLHPDDKVRTANDVDRFISAQIPNPRTQKALYERVKTHMIHGTAAQILQLRHNAI